MPFLLPRALAALLVIPALGVSANAQTPHASFTVAVTGKGPALLLIPGLLSAARVIMAERARHFIMFDDPSFLFSALDHFLGVK